VAAKLDEILSYPASYSRLFYGNLSFPFRHYIEKAGWTCAPRHEYTRSGEQEADQPVDEE
jgi:hypothetical protein